MELCRKGLHKMTETMTMRRVIGRKKSGEPYYSTVCRGCYNERLKLYMRTYRKSKLAEVNHAVD